jgi:hypothetical protein
MVSLWYALHTLLIIAPRPAESVTFEREIGVCEISDHPARYIGRQVVVDALLVNAQPHSIYIRDPKDRHCILDIGSMAAGEGEVFDYFIVPERKPTPFVWEAKVRIQAVLRSEMRDSPFTGSDRKYRSYFLDQMKVIRLQP